MEPRCWCGRVAVLRTSWTDANPGRRFWGCLRFMEDRANACNYHLWFDGPMCPRSRTIIPGLLRKVEKLEDELKKVEDELKKVEDKLKKLEAAAEMKGNKRRHVLLLMVLIFLLWSFVVMNKNVQSVNKGQYELP